MIELAAVMVILVILTITAVPSIAKVGKTRAASAARQLASDVNYARQLAVTTGRTTWIECEPDADRWRLLAETDDSPGRANALPHVEAATGRPFVTEVNAAPYYGVVILSCDFDGERQIGFDWRGRPLTDDETPLVATGAVQFSGGFNVVVEPKTGFVEYMRP